MDLGGSTTTTATTPESTVVVEKPCTAPEESENPPASGKNGSVPDSSANSKKEMAPVADSPVKKEVLSSSPKKASDDGTVFKACELNSTVDPVKSSSKQTVTTCSSDDAVKQESKSKDKELAKSDITLNTTHRALEHCSKKEQSNDNPVDSEDDDLLRRMEAIEKGEDLDLKKEKEDAKKDGSNHQNGVQEEGKLSKIPAVKPVDTSAVAAKMSSDVSVAKQSRLMADVKEESETVPIKSAEVAVNSNAKRKYPLNEVESNEPEVKKVHVNDVTDGPVETSTIIQPCDLVESAGPLPASSKSLLEKPPSVEKMEVDGSPEPETSKYAEVLLDTDPNTGSDAMEVKSEEISSSVAEESMRQDSDSTANMKPDNSNVSSSSDDKQEATNEKTKPSVFEISASVLPAPSKEEAMDVDEDVSDTAESSTSSGGPAVSAPISVVEPPCVKKVAYQCTENEQNVTETVEKDVVSPTESASTSSTVDSVKMEVDSGVKASSSKAVGAKTLIQGEDEVDSSNVATTEPEVVGVAAVDKPLESAKMSTADESVVESSQPSSSSDTKKQPVISENRLDEHQLREAMNCSGLLAKTTSTPNNSAAVATPSSSNPSTPKTLNTVTASAVSSSNVYSSTPIHPNFGKVSSGSVSKIKNPPSSVEMSRIETDESTVSAATTTVTNTSSNTEQSTSLEEKKLSSPSAALKVETASLPITVSAATSDSSAELSSSSKKEFRQDDFASSAKSSLKTASDVSEVDSCTVGSDMNTAEEINLYMSSARKLNGISSTSEGSDLEAKSKSSSEQIKQEEGSKPVVDCVHLDISHAISPTTSSKQQYEVSVWYDEKELQFMSVERLFGGEKVDSSVAVDAAKHDSSSKIDSSSKQSSSTTTNGSVSSFEPFALPTTGQSSNMVQASDSSSSSVVTVTGVKSVHSLTVPQVKQTVMGPKALCDLIIDEFKKLRRTFAPDDAESPEDADDAHLGTKSYKTPAAATGGRGRTKESAKKSVSRGQKRSKVADSDDDDEVGLIGGDNTPRTGSSSSASKQPIKRAKGGSTEVPVTSSAITLKPKTTAVPESKQFDICCLARWTDRKYYAGRVTNYRGDNKYVVVFEDGCSKTLSRDIIVFGEEGVLPIKHHSIHALTGGDTYEPAIVEEIKHNEGNEVVYGVQTASSTLEVTATDIYLTDEQAKWIHNTCKDKPDPIQQLLAGGQGVSGVLLGEGGDAGASVGSAVDGNSATLAASDLTPETGMKGSRSTRSKRSAATSDKSMAPGTPEAGYSGGVGKQGRRGRRKQFPPPESHIPEYSDASDNYEDEIPIPESPDTGLDAVNGVQPELQRTEQESELARMYLIATYFSNDVENSLNELLGPIPIDAKTLFRNKHFLLTCTVPPKDFNSVGSKNKQFSHVPFVKQHLRQQIEAGGGRVYQFFEDVPKNKYNQCKLIAPRPSTTAMYVQCLASDIAAVSHEWIVQCCQVLTLVDVKPYALPAGWSFVEERFIEWRCGRRKGKGSTAAPFASVSINVASLCKDFNDFWSRVCKLAGATVRLIKTEYDVTENLTGYLLTDQEFPEEIKIKAARNGLLVVSTVWVVQCLISDQVCHPSSNQKLTQIYQEDDY
uniref:BRCT domain-containing protein n=1 Tax=Anopheles dirus TaxID=7168 RepID=A0A182NA05_9DIPT